MIRDKRRTIIRILLTAASAMLTTLAMLPPARVIYEPFSHLMQDYSAIKAILAGLLCVYYWKTLFSAGFKPRVRISTLVFACGLSLCMLIGNSFQAYYSWEIFYGANVILLSVGMFAGFLLFFYSLAEQFFFRFGQACLCIKEGGPPECSNDERRRKKSGAVQRITTFLIDRRPLLIPFVVCFLAWLPYWLIAFPGTMFFDTHTQLLEYFGQLEWSNHHPVFSSLLLGLPMDLGRVLMDDTLGLFLGVLLQQLITAFVCAYVMKTFKAWGAPRLVRIAALVFFAGHPLIAYTNQNFSKDTISYALLCLFCLLYLDVIHSIRLGRPAHKKLAAAVAAAVFASLLRHNNLYIVVLSLVALVFLRQSAMRRLLCACAALLCFLCARFISDTLNSTFNAKSGSISEALSIPFQQTARYVYEYGYDVTPGEMQAIDAVLAYDALTINYKPDLSDPVKFTYKGDDEALPAYFRAWWSMFLRHPDAYFEATISNTFAYYCPGTEYKALPIVFSGDNTTSEAFFHIDYTPASTVEAAYVRLLAFKELPIIGVLFNQGCITWILLFFMLWLHREKRSVYITGFIPALITLLTCIASPVNGYWRYYQPILMMLPLLFVWTVCGIFGAVESAPGRQEIL